VNIDRTAEQTAVRESVVRFAQRDDARVLDRSSRQATERFAQPIGRFET
jgi:hypothetical protein